MTLRRAGTDLSLERRPPLGVSIPENSDALGRVIPRMNGGKGTDWAGRRLHFVGIGGAGMSGLALVAQALGARVTGSDAAETPYLAELREAGIKPAIGHGAEHVPDGAELVYSTAVPEDNPEREEARRRGLPEIHRGDLLGELTRL